jgi:hypothetical protein
MLRILHCLDSRLTDGGKAVGLTRRPLLYSPKHYSLLLVLISVQRNVVKITYVPSREIVTYLMKVFLSCFQVIPKCRD